jgi:hypothetical protein
MFNLDLETRLSRWAQFRRSLEEVSDPLDQVVKFWSQAPLSSYVTHVGQCDHSWPSPWKLLDINRYDDKIVAIMMGYTVKLTNRYAQSAVELKTMIDSRRTKLYNLIFIDDTYVLNYLKDQVVTVDKLESNLYTSDLVTITAL